MPKSVGHPFFFPDPNDVTPNNPTTFVDSGTILSLYNQENPDTTMQRYCQTVIDWFCTYEKTHKWDDAEPLTGTINGVILTNKAVKRANK